MSALDRKYKAGGGEIALLLVLIFALVGVPAILYVVVTVGQALTPRPRPLPAGYWERSLGTFTGAIPWRTTELVLAATAGWYWPGCWRCGYGSVTRRPPRPSSTTGRRCAWLRSATSPRSPRSRRRPRRHASGWRHRG
ncbi:hypothetical protein [Kocuria atrinae]|uniref:hypothetical protein n=1 Tax=Kocuria atrinae TaxID=592377 RepID=UPI0002FB37F2|nr:hypothetical protein [Kocuria atrinae]